MSYLERLRQWWRENPDNSDNWDLDRWKREQVSGLRQLGIMGMIFVVVIGVCIGIYWDWEIFPAFFAMLGIMLFYSSFDVWYSRNIRRLEAQEEEAGE